jgi:hypothetical protein
MDKEKFGPIWGNLFATEKDGGMVLSQMDRGSEGSEMAWL